MGPLTQLLAYLAGQPSPAPAPLEQVDNPLWPYWVAVASLASVVVTLFGLLVKAYRDKSALQTEHAAEIKALNKAFNDATEEKSKRVAEEFDKKDKAILETSVEFAKLMERVANQLARIGDDPRRPG